MRLWPAWNRGRGAKAASSETASKRGARSRLVTTWRVVRWVLPAIALIGLHLWLFPPSRSIKRIQLEVGTITDEEVRAPFSFTAPRPARELELARREAAQRAEPVYRVLEGAEPRSEQRRQQLFRGLKEAAAEASAPVEARVARLQRLFPGLSAESLRYLLETDRLTPVTEAVAAVARNQLAAGIVDITPRGTYAQIRVLDPVTQAETSRSVSAVVLGYRMREAVEADLRALLQDNDDVEAGVELALHLLVPNLSYDDAETERRRDAAASSVPAVREFARNERILEAGVRVTRDHLAVLEALEATRVERALAQDATIAVRLRLGRILLLVVVLGGLLFLVHLSSPRVIADGNRYTVLVLLCALYLALSALVLRHPSWGGPMAVPIVLLAMLSTILFGDRVGLWTSLAGVLLVGILSGYESANMVVWMVAAGISVWMMRKVRNRNQFYKAIGVVTLGYVLTVGGLNLGVAESVRAALASMGIAAASAVACTALCLFLLPLFESAFGITTDLTLLELSDLNHPLLRRMSLESPGTYHHSQVVGSLAEGGARAIGANSLLARVGANFHDIGKMLKPRYYVENQSGENKHDDLSPSMSALVIAAHVKDGMELGRQWGLPKEVVAYIPEHHGTSVMQYFYHKALETEGGTVKVDDFRYPGPKPQTKETAIVMLADGVEASTRSLRRPTPSRVREMVRKIIDRKMAEGELDESGLSLQELAKVREAFIPILVGIHHQRVAYPGQEQHEAKKEKESVEARSRHRRSGSSVASGT